MKPGKIILIIVVILAVGIGAYALMKNNDKNDDTTNTTNNSSSSGNAEEGPAGASQSATITYSESGFGPSEITVLAGAVVTVKNDTSETLGFQSDPHPVHNENTELNIDDIGPGESRSFSVDNIGTWGYHNHLDPDKTGTIIVVER